MRFPTGRDGKSCSGALGRLIFRPFGWEFVTRWRFSWQFLLTPGFWEIVRNSDREMKRKKKVAV
jgi:hypothetical protein